tara:strand:- start:655 stop:846 length:192 start_codon:yes stop_codon:yes gene_type:complete
MGAFQFLGKPVVSVSKIRYISGSLWVNFLGSGKSEKFKISEKERLSKVNFWVVDNLDVPKKSP